MSAQVDPHPSFRRFLRLGPSRADHLPALRITAGLAVPLACLLLAGRIDWALYAGFGAFTGIYSRGEPTRLRAQRQALMGVVLTLCVTVGALIASVGERVPAAVEVWLALVVTAIVAGVVAVLVRVRGIRPAGSLFAVFAVFAVAAVASAPPAAPVAVAALVAGSVSALCVVLGILGQWLGEAHHGQDPPAPPPVPWRARWADAGLYAGVALAAGSLAALAGISHPYWAQIAAIVPLSVTGTWARVERGIHRVVGTCAGVVVTAFLLSFPSQPWQLVVWVVLMQFLTELFVLRHYSLALLFITPLALLMVQLGHPQPVGPLLQARVVETAVGVTVGLATVLALFWARRSHARGGAAARG